MHPSYPYSNSSNYQSGGQPIVNNVISPGQQSHPNGPPNTSNPLMHLQHTANNAYHSSSMNSQNCGLPPNTLNMSNNSLHPSNNQIPPNQIMHSAVPPHMQQATEADQLNVSRQQMTTNSRLKSFIQNRQHNGITKTPVYSPTQSPIGYSSKYYYF